MFCGSKRSLMACMTSDLRAGRPPNVGGGQSGAVGMPQHDQLAARRRGDRPQADRAGRRRTAFRPIAASPGLSRGEGAYTYHAIAGMGLDRALGIDRQYLGHRGDHCARQHVDLDVGGKIGKPSPQRLRVGGGNEHRRSRAGGSPLLAELLDHPVDFRRGPLESDVQPADIAFADIGPNSGSFAGGRPATKSMATGRVGDWTNRPAVSPPPRNRARRRPASTDASASGRTINVACVSTPSVPSEPAIRRHML